jgi:recombinational DNA repair ATPase RecF
LNVHCTLLKKLRTRRGANQRELRNTRRRENVPFGGVTSKKKEGKEGKRNVHLKDEIAPYQGQPKAQMQQAVEIHLLVILKSQHLHLLTGKARGRVIQKV